MANLRIINGVISTDQDGLIINSSGSTTTGERSAVIGGQSLGGAADDTVYLPNVDVDETLTVQDLVINGTFTPPSGEPVFSTINIGDWNMDTTTLLSVAHSLSATEWKTIRGLTAEIRNDADTTYYIFSGPGGSNPQDGTIVSFDSTNINLGRNTGGIYNSTSFDSTSYNRGWVTFWYTPD